MDLAQFVEYCIVKRGVTQDFPFDDKVLVMRVMDKIFALCAIDSDPLRINLKCAPQRAIELRERYAEIEPGYHMNKKHWNTVSAGGELSDILIEELIDHSYDLVVSKLTKVQREKLSVL